MPGIGQVAGRDERRELAEVVLEASRPERSGIDYEPLGAVLGRHVDGRVFEGLGKHPS